MIAVFRAPQARTLPLEDASLEDLRQPWRGHFELEAATGRSAAKLMPGGIRTQLRSPALSDPGTERRINGRYIAFQKLSEDERRWDWFADF